MGPKVVAMEKSSIRFAEEADASLLVLDIPEELSATASPLKCFAIPLVSRVGGMALMVPLSAIDQEKLLDEVHHDGDGLLGPSKSFMAELYSEDDDGNSVGIGVNCRFLVVDFSDDILAFLHDYDDSLDDAMEILTYDLDHPTSLPSTSGIPEQVRAWAGESAAGRVHFYSAQEDPGQHTPPAKSVAAVPKKSGSKKITTAALAEMVQQLSLQVQALSSQSDRPAGLGTKATPKRSADPVTGPLVGGVASTAKLPGVSESLQVGRVFGTPSMDAVHKAAMSVGPPPKVRGQGPVLQLFR